MKNKPKINFSFIAQLVTGAVLTPLTISIATSPTQAASLASSQGKLEISNLSQSPLSTQTLTNAEELVNSLNTAPFNSNTFSNSTNPQPAESQARASSFLVEAGKTFSFDFAADLNATTSIDDATSESANTNGYTAFFLVDVNQQKIYDSFFLAANVESPGVQDSLFFQKSDNVTLTQTVLADNFNQAPEFARASIKGSLNRSFENPTALALIEATVNRPGGSEIESPSKPGVAVPESSNSLALFLLLGSVGIGYQARKKRLEQTKA